jgi:hypothetical protein
MTFAVAVEFFKRAGFEIEPGPRECEVTLVRREADYVSTTVWPLVELTRIAEMAMDYFHTNQLMARLQSRGQLQ